MNTMKVLFNVIIITFTHLVAVKHLLLFLICIMEFEYVFSKTVRLSVLTTIYLNFCTDAKNEQLPPTFSLRLF